MFGQFIKPRWQHRDPAVRITAIGKLTASNDEHREILARLAEHDSDASVRRTAVAQLLEISLLGQLQQRDADDSVRAAAAEQIQRLLSGQVQHGPSLENRIRLIALTDNASVLNYVALNSDDADCRLGAIARLNDESALCELALQGQHEATRVAATARISDDELLKKIVRDGRDKRVLRLAREQLKTQQSAASEQQQAEQRAARVVEELQAHVRRTHDNLYQPRFDQLIASWREISEHANATLKQQADAAIAECQQRLQERQQEQQQAAAIAQAQFEQQETLATLQQIQSTLTAQSWHDSNSLRALVTTQRNRWDAATEQHPADSAIEQKVSEQLTLWQQCFEHVAALNALNDAQGAANSERVENNTDDETSASEPVTEEPTQDATEAVTSDIENPVATVTENAPTDEDTTHDSVSPVSETDSANAAEIAKQYIALRNLWPAAFPMPEQLAQATMPAPEQAPADNKKSRGKNDAERAIQNILGALQRELRQRNLKHANRLWRKAETVLADMSEAQAPSSKKIIASAKTKLEKLKPQLDELRDWQAFAADPKKDQLCTDMEALIDSPMDAAEKAGAIHALHDAWRELMSADQDADQDLWDRFRSASDKAYEPCREHFREVDALRKENMKKRQAMVKQLQNFIDQQDWQSADWPRILEIRRAAPNEWKSYQPINFTEVRDLGRTFSKILSTLDEKLKEASNTNSATLEQLIDAAKALLEQQNSRDSIDQLKALQARWKQAGWVQAGRYHSLHKTFRKTADQLFAQLDDQRKAYKNEMQEQATELKTALTAFSQALDAEEAADALPALQQQASALAAMPCPNREKKLDEQRQVMLQRLKQLKQWRPAQQRWKAIVDQINDSPSQDETPAQRQLAVAIEYAVGSESPEDARDERMQWQLKQLQHAMTGGNQRSPMDSVAEILKSEATVLESGISDTSKARLISALRTLEPKR